MINVGNKNNNINNFSISPNEALAVVAVGGMFAALGGGFYHIFSETLSRRKVGPIIDSCARGGHVDPDNPHLFLKEKDSSIKMRKARELLIFAQGEEVKEYQALLKTMENSKKTKSDFKKEEWAAYDRVTFSLTQDRLVSIQKSFNSGYYDEIAYKMEKQFHIDFKEAFISEVLSRSLAYSLGHDGKTLQIPVKNEMGKYVLVDYKITSFNLGDQLPAYILESDVEGASPWIVARGTETVVSKDEKGNEYRAGAVESLFADSIDVSGLAKEAVAKGCINKQNGMNLKDHFKKWEMAGTKVKLAGHSLGGYMMYDLAIRFYDQIERAYGFCAPAVGSTQAKLWNAIVGESPSEREKIVNFISENDFVPSAGSELIGINIAMSPSHGNLCTNPLQNHSRYILPGNFKAQAIDPKAESEKWARPIANKVRNFVGDVFAAALPKFGNSYVPEWWVNKKNYQFV